jgi:hypothetical protein
MKFLCRESEKPKMGAVRCVDEKATRPGSSNVSPQNHRILRSWDFRIPPSTRRLQCQQKSGWHCLQGRSVQADHGPSLTGMNQSQVACKESSVPWESDRLW